MAPENMQKKKKDSYFMFLFSNTDRDPHYSPKQKSMYSLHEELLMRKVLQPCRLPVHFCCK